MISALEQEAFLHCLRLGSFRFGAATLSAVVSFFYGIVYPLSVYCMTSSAFQQYAEFRSDLPSADSYTAVMVVRRTGIEVVGASCAVVRVAVIVTVRFARAVTGCAVEGRTVPCGVWEWQYAPFSSARSASHQAVYPFHSVHADPTFRLQYMHFSCFGVMLYGNVKRACIQLQTLFTLIIQLFHLSP